MGGTDNKQISFLLPLLPTPSEIPPLKKCHYTGWMGQWMSRCTYFILILHHKKESEKSGKKSLQFNTCVSWENKANGSLINCQISKSSLDYKQWSFSASCLCSMKLHKTQVSDKNQYTVYKSGLDLVLEEHFFMFNIHVLWREPSSILPFSIFSWKMKFS